MLLKNNSLDLSLDTGFMLFYFLKRLIFADLFNSRIF
jgi:hypothetical protein